MRALPEAMVHRFSGAALTNLLHKPLSKLGSLREVGFTNVGSRQYHRLQSTQKFYLRVHGDTRGKRLLKPHPNRNATSWLLFVLKAFTALNTPQSGGEVYQAYQKESETVGDASRSLARCWVS